jgi:alcohol dehydrogenase (cytochrome c)
MLIDGVINGDAHKLITHSGRNGFVYTMERNNGQTIFAKPYIDNINWTKGIDQKTGKPVDYDPAKDVQTYSGAANQNPGAPVKKVCPSIAGGNNYWPSSYSRQTKLIYIPALTGCVDVTVGINPQRPFDGGSYKIGERLESNLTAVDPVTGEIKKNVHLRYPNYSGTLATAGGLIFLGLTDGTVAAYDDATLDELWKINMGSGFSAPPMTFAVNGKQYVAITSGPSATARRKLVNTPELKDQRNATVIYVFSM